VNINLVIVLIGISSFVMSGGVLFKMLILRINETHIKSKCVIISTFHCRLRKLFSWKLDHKPQINVAGFTICCHASNAKCSEVK